VEVREVDERELALVVEVQRAVRPRDPLSVTSLVDWRRQASDMAWMVALEDGRPVGAGIGVIGWHSRPGVALVEAWTLPSERGRGVASEIFRALAAWASVRGCIELRTDVDEDDPDSLAWAERHGFREIGRSTRLALALAEIEPPATAPPDGIEIVRWSDHPGLERGMYAVYLEAEPDIPGEQDNVLPSFEEWLAADMQGDSDTPEAVFVALADGEVVGFAKLSIMEERGDTAWHDLTGVLRAWRGRGIASALKRAQIAWAKEQGFSRLVTANEERNAPIRALNEGYGYRPEPGRITLHTILDATD
jgi:RimJ/RimL family protein N-acetyltransferase